MSIDNAHNMEVSYEDALQAARQKIVSLEESLREAALQAALRETALREAALREAALQAAHQAALQKIVSLEESLHEAALQAALHAALPDAALREKGFRDALRYQAVVYEESVRKTAVNGDNALRSLAQRATATIELKNKELKDHAEHHAEQMKAKDKELKDQAKRLEDKDKELKAQYEQIAMLKEILRCAKDDKIRMDMAMSENESEKKIILLKMQTMHQEVNATYNAELARLSAEIARLSAENAWLTSTFDIACGNIDRAIEGQKNIMEKLRQPITVEKATEMLKNVIEFKFLFNLSSSS